MLALQLPSPPRLCSSTAFSHHGRLHLRDDPYAAGPAVDRLTVMWSLAPTYRSTSSRVACAQHGSERTCTSILPAARLPQHDDRPLVKLRRHAIFTSPGGCRRPIMLPQPSSAVRADGEHGQPLSARSARGRKYKGRTHKKGERGHILIRRDGVLYLSECGGAVEMALGHDGRGGAVRPPGGAVCDAAAAAPTEDYRQGKRQRGGADRLPGGSDCLHVAEVVVNTPARQRRGR
jgi:hypothetical protein